MSGKGQLRRDPPVDAAELLRMARERIRGCTHFAKHDECVRIEIEGGRLVLLGRVPTFYLKSVLQNMLVDLPGIAGIDNRVDVVACDGLSSSQNWDIGL
ncbi:MAG: hypothetical protein KDA37_09725 [Planctomycetales bacterium]|nr:hypothetical protein [Planctomycetales bacterium]